MSEASIPSNLSNAEGSGGGGSGGGSGGGGLLQPRLRRSIQSGMAKAKKNFFMPRLSVFSGVFPKTIEFIPKPG
jgi:hypothetical protein